MVKVQRIFQWWQLVIATTGYNQEDIEKIHNNLILKSSKNTITKSIDAPSGTALMLADEINKELNQPYSYTYDRHSVREKRTKKEIGLHAIRGGTIVGDHDIIFAGRDEVITLFHQAASKEVFAVGAVNAAVFLKKEKNQDYII